MSTEDHGRRWSGRFPRVRAAGWIGLALAGLAFLLGLSPVDDPDTWWHIRMGEIVVTEGHVPHQDVFSHTVLGHKDIAHEWLAEVVFYLLDRWTGLLGIRVLNGIAAALCAWLLWRLFYRGTGAILPSLFAFGLTFPDFFVRIHFRPEIFSLPLEIALVGMLIHLDRRSLSYGRLAVLAVAVALWANLHAMAVMSLILLAAFTAGEWGTLLVRRWFDPSEWRVTTWASARWLTAACLVTSLALLATPNLLEIYAYVLASREHLIAGPLQIMEWRPPLGLLAGASQQFLHTNPLTLPIAGAFQFFFLLIPLGFFASVPYLSKRRETPALGSLLLALTAIYLGSSAVRLRWMFFVPVYFIAKALAASLAPRKAAAGARWTALRPLASLVTIPLMIAVGAAGFYTLGRDGISLGANQREEGYPVGLCNFLNELDVGGPLFNPYNWGGYLIYRVTPRYQVFIDGRTILYETTHPTITRDYITIERQATGYRELLSDYGVELLLVDGRQFFPRGPLAEEISFIAKAAERGNGGFGEPARAEAKGLFAPGGDEDGAGSGAEPAAGEPGWVPLLLNQEGSLYLADRPQTSAKIEEVRRFFEGIGVAWSREEGIDLVDLIRNDPVRAVRYRVLPTDLWLSLKSIDGKTPGGVPAAVQLKWAQSLLALGLLPEAEEAFDRLLKEERYNESGLLGAAYAHHLLGDNVQASRCVERYQLFARNDYAAYLAYHLKEHAPRRSVLKGRLPDLDQLLVEWRPAFARG